MASCLHLWLDAHMSATTLKPGAAEALHEARERLGLSRVDLERATRKAGHKVSEATIFNIEKGISSKPYPRTIYALAAVLDLDPADLLYRQEVAS